jgi:hypothetical protein
MLLYDGVSTTDPSQTARVIAGATLLALGLTVMPIVLKNWWEWRKIERRYRNE